MTNDRTPDDAIAEFSRTLAALFRQWTSRAYAAAVILWHNDERSLDFAGLRRIDVREDARMYFDLAVTAGDSSAIVATFDRATRRWSATTRHGTKKARRRG